MIEVGQQNLSFRIWIQVNQHMNKVLCLNPSFIIYPCRISTYSISLNSTIELIRVTGVSKINCSNTSLIGVGLKSSKSAQLERTKDNSLITNMRLPVSVE